jgi:glyoxylase-like metal-dependent hydrolase (beta-lactamase superfamily II)
LHIEGMIEDGETIPAASTLETVMAERAHRDAVAFLVKAPAQHSRSVRVNITLPEDVLVLPSHGEPFYGLHARLDWLAAHHAERLSLLMDAMADSSAHDLLPVLFRRPLDLRNLGFGLGETLAHLRRLQVMGEVAVEQDTAGVMRWRRL